jgi:ABC-type lipoprotein release transport system permease subunit
MYHRVNHARPAPRRPLRLTPALGTGAKAFGVTALGVAAGLAGALALSRVMQGCVSRIASTDPLTLVLASLLLALVALPATYMPARRAARVDPIVALRCE